MAAARSESRVLFPAQVASWARLLAFGCGLVSLAACDQTDERRIRLAGVAEPRPEVQRERVVVRSDEQRIMAILEFANETEDDSLEWLRRGLSDMLATELSQSSYLRVIGTGRVDELLAATGRGAADLADDAVAAQAASEAGIETFLAGRYRSDGDALVIEVDLREIGSGRSFRVESVRGPVNLERIFSMVSELSRSIREDLRGDLDTARDKGLEVSEMTDSVEAFRHYSRGLDNIDKLLITEARADFQRAVETDPTFAAAGLRLGELEARHGDLEAGMERLQVARAHADRLSDADKVRLGLFEADINNDVEQIHRLMGSLLDAAPDDIETRMIAAQMLFSRQDYERALVEYEAIRELEPQRKLVYNQLAYTQAFRGDFDSALKYLRHYQQLTPDEPNAWDSTGEVLMMAGRLEDAIEYFERALARWPNFHNSMANLARIHAELGNEKRALEYTDRWAESAPSDRLRAEAIEFRGLILWKFGRIEAADAEFARARTVAPGRMDGYRWASAMHAELGDSERAVALRRECFDRHRPSAGVDREIGTAARFAHYCLRAGGAQPDLLAEMQGLDASHLPFGEGDLVTLYLGLLALRAGDQEAANRLFGGSGGEVIDRLFGAWKVNRSWVWRYVVEAVQLSPNGAPALVARVKAAAATSGHKGHLVLARQLEIQAARRRGDLAMVASGLRDLGVANEDDWLVIGPFSHANGFHRRFAPEIDPRPGRQLNDDRGQPLTWHAAADGTPDGYVDFGNLFQQSSWQVAYAQIGLESPDHRVVQIRMSADDAVKLWVNDELVWQAYHLKETGVDHDIVKVALRAGDNRLLIKVANAVADWGFYLRVTDDHGDGHPDLRFHPVYSTSARLH